MIARRQFIAGAALLPAMLEAGSLAAKPALSPAKLARDETYWRQVASQYELPQGITQLENGNWGVMSKPVLDAYFRNQRKVNRESSYYTRREFGPEWVAVRKRVADMLGVRPDEIALTRNATEALQCLIGGYNNLKPGDAVLYADHDYSAMQSAMDWLRNRRGVDVIRIKLPEPATWQGMIDAYAQALDANPRVRLILLTHLGHRSGLVLPIREITEMAAARGVDAIVDAAHSVGQLDFKLPALGASFVGFNLHKWIGAPLGVGGFYIAKDRIPDIDPHMTDLDDTSTSINARVHSGTANFAATMTVPDAIDFQEAIGGATKEARLRHLRNLWAEELRDMQGLEILTPADPRLSCGITSFRFSDRRSMADNEAVARELLERFKIFTVARDGLANGACVRVTPALFNSSDDIARLTSALRTMSKAA